MTVQPGDLAGVLAFLQSVPEWVRYSSFTPEPLEPERNACDSESRVHQHAHADAQMELISQACLDPP